jgi:hypothetical protein
VEASLAELWNAAWLDPTALKLQKTMVVLEEDFYVF